MSDMVEKVARAIWALQRDTDCNDYDKLWDGPGSAKEIARNMARAAIEAMREPTPDMERAADNCLHYCEECKEGTSHPVVIWPAMIDAALSTKGE